jgi:hypothetical protein
MTPAAAASDRSSATLANIASPSEVRQLDISATISFCLFYFETLASATDL